MNQLRGYLVVFEELSSISYAFNTHKTTCPPLIISPEVTVLNTVASVFLSDKSKTRLPPFSNQTISCANRTAAQLANPRSQPPVPVRCPDQIESRHFYWSMPLGTWGVNPRCLAHQRLLCKVNVGKLRLTATWKWRKGISGSIKKRPE